MKKLTSVFVFILLALTFIIGTASAETVSSTTNFVSANIQTQASVDQSFGTQSAMTTSAIAEGVIVCDAEWSGSFGSAICDWGLNVIGDKITYSNVTVNVQKMSIYGTYSTIATKTFSYSVNPAKSFIQDQAAFSFLDAGFYRVTLGGSFTCLESGVYVAGFTDPDNFYLG